MREVSPISGYTKVLSSSKKITLGSTKLSEYTKVGVLGKGTYGEVHKCLHNPTGLIIAMKTYTFEVSFFCCYNRF